MINQIINSDKNPSIKLPRQVPLNVICEWIKNLIMLQQIYTNISWISKNENFEKNNEK